MNTSIRYRRAVLLACLVGLGAPGAHAQIDDPTILKNRFTGGARFSFNISGEIRNLPVAPNVGPVYDDGFSVRDASGGAGGKTWYWGYDRPDQLVSDGIALHGTVGSPRDGTSQSLEDDPNVGFEILYGRDLLYVPFSENTGFKLGVEVGFGALDVNLATQDTMTGLVPRKTGIFGLGGVTPPLPPYQGTFEGPGPLLDLSPRVTNVEDVTATSTFDARVRSLVYGFKLGPYFDLPVYRRFSVQLGAGLAAVVADTTFEYSEVITVAATGGAPPPRSGEWTGTETLLGFYGNALVVYAISESMDFYVGGQYQHLGDVGLTGGSKEASLDLGQVFELLVGLRVRF